MKDGDFYLNGQKWYAFGVNYWPRYAIRTRVAGCVPWLDPVVYDPTVVEKDLANIEALGMTMVSIQILASEFEPDVWQVPTLRMHQISTASIREERVKAVNDFLRRVERHGLRVNVYLPGADPLYFNERRFKHR